MKNLNSLPLDPGLSAPLQDQKLPLPDNRFFGDKMATNSRI